MCWSPEELDIPTPDEAKKAKERQIEEEISDQCREITDLLLNAIRAMSPDKQEALVPLREPLRGGVLGRVVSAFRGRGWQVAYSGGTTVLISAIVIPQAAKG